MMSYLLQIVILQPHHFSTAGLKDVASARKRATDFQNDPDGMVQSRDYARLAGLCSLHLSMWW